MATTRPIFMPNAKAPYVSSKDVTFEWSGGFALVQKQKCIRALHANAKLAKNNISNILEISTKSDVELGTHFSAFNLKLKLGEIESSVEGMYQGAKVFRKCGPHPEWRGLNGKEIKKELKKLVESGKIEKDESHRAFALEGEYWRVSPVDLFFDWLYFHGVWQLEEKQPDLINALMEYDAFTDINFNPKKGINCQARSLAKYVALKREGVDMGELLKEPTHFATKLFGTERYCFAHLKGA